MRPASRAHGPGPAGLPDGHSSIGAVAVERSLMVLCRLKEGCEVWTDVAARGGNVRTPPPGGMGSSERQGTLAGGGGGTAGQESRGPIAVAVPSSQLWAPAFPSKAGPGSPSTARPLRTASRESRGRPTEGRRGRGAVTGSSHAFTPSLTHSFIHSFSPPESTSQAPTLSGKG